MIDPIDYIIATYGFDPRAKTGRYTPKRRMAIVEAIDIGAMTEAEAMRVYSISEAELAEWRVTQRSKRSAT